MPDDAAQAARQLHALGVPRGAVLVVHCAFSRVGPLAGGPDTLIDALLAVLGPEGTLVMPSMTDDDDAPFDPLKSECRGMGIVADTFWRCTGVARSDSPHAFAAVGPQAAAITAPHPADVPHGPDSPIGRVHALDGHVLLLGVGHDANTTVHLAEHLAGVRYRIRRHATIWRAGVPVRIDCDEIDHCCARFERLDQRLPAQRRGGVGRAPARLVRARDVVDAALALLRTDETAFLHPRGACAECDEARRAIDRAGTLRASAC